MSKKIHHKNINLQTGFTLVEIMVSITMFSLIVGSLAAAVVTSTQTLRVMHEKTVASYLTQEAMEYVKNIRDAETVNPSGTWYGAPLAPCLDTNPNDSTDIKCTIDTTSDVPLTAVDQCNVSTGCTPMRYDDSTGVYAYTGQITPYTREVKLIHPDPVSGSNPNGTGDDEVLVEVTVRWQSGTQTREMKLYHSIFNWQG